SDVKLTAAPLSGGKSVAVKLVKPRATFEQRGLPVAATIDADARSAWAIDPQFGKDHAAVYELAEPISNDGGTKLTFTLSFNNNTGHNFGRVRLSVSASATAPVVAGSGMPADVQAALARLDDGKTLDDATKATLAKWHRAQDAGWSKIDASLRQHRAK